MWWCGAGARTHSGIVYGMSRFKEGSWFTMFRMKPTPESSEGAGDARVLGALGVVVTRVAALVWETLRARLGTGVDIARVLLSHVGLSRVTVTLTAEAWPSSECGVTFLLVGVGAARRLAGRGACKGSFVTRRVPNFALAEDSRAYAVVGVVVRRGGPVVPVGLVLTGTGFWSVTLSAPQYEKLILLLRSESSESFAASSSSSGMGTMRGWTLACACCLDLTTL